jgi:serine/threonine protein kinase
LYLAEREGVQLCLKEHRYGFQSGTNEAEEGKKLFLREGKTLASLCHEQIPRYIDSFSTNGGEEKLYLVMEYIEGQNLTQLLDNKRVNVDYVIKVAKEIATILTYIHSFTPEIIHRDIKPGNILQPDGLDSKVKLIDFGTCTSAVLKGTMATQTQVGSFGYSAPEVWHNRQTKASDIYSLGAVMLNLLSGGKDVIDFMNDDNRLSFRNKLGEIPAWLEQLVHDMTEPNKTKRIKNSEELIARLYTAEQWRNTTLEVTSKKIDSIKTSNEEISTEGTNEFENILVHHFARGGNERVHHTHISWLMSDFERFYQSLNIECQSIGLELNKPSYSIIIDSNKSPWHSNSVEEITSLVERNLLDTSDIKCISISIIDKEDKIKFNGMTSDDCYSNKTLKIPNTNNFDFHLGVYSKGKITSEQKKQLTDIVLKTGPSFHKLPSKPESKKQLPFWNWRRYFPKDEPKQLEN